MDRLFANGTVNAAQSGQGSGNLPALFLFHSLLSDRASFDAIVPRLSQSHRVIVPDLPGFGGSKALGGGLPIKAGNEVIGAIGVSGSPGADKDEACATAGIAQAADKLK